MTGEVKNLPRDVGSDIRPKIQADGAAQTAVALFQSKRRLPPGLSGGDRRLFLREDFGVAIHCLARSCQNATAEAAATFRESTSRDIGMRAT